MKQLVLETLKRITKEKILNKKYPTHVMYVELINELGREIRPVLNELWHEKKIKVGNTINDKCIELIEPRI